MHVVSPLGTAVSLVVVVDWAFAARAAAARMRRDLNNMIDLWL
jgi:hypothetical protein